MTTTHRTIDLGSERRSGRTTLMLATLAGLQRMGTAALYVANTSTLSALARAQTGHDLRCMSVEQFIKCQGAVDYAAIGLDNVGMWGYAYQDRVTELIRHRRPALILRSD